MRQRSDDFPSMQNEVRCSGLSGMENEFFQNIFSIQYNKSSIREEKKINLPHLCQLDQLSESELSAKARQFACNCHALLSAKDFFR